MKSLATGDIIRDNLGRLGLVLEKARKPGAKWLAEQNDAQMRTASGPWWHVVPLDGGGVLVPEDLARHLRRATVDDVLKVINTDDNDGGQATLYHLFKSLQSAQCGPSMRSSRPAQKRAVG